MKNVPIRMQRYQRRNHTIIRWCALVCCLLAVGIGLPIWLHDAGAAAPVPSATITVISQTPAPDQSPEATPAPTPSATPEATPAPEPSPVPSVDASDFGDAVFIGDSRSEGLSFYGLLPAENVYAHKGLMAETAATKPFIQTAAGAAPISIHTALQKRVFGRVYIMLGINELGWVYPEMFIQKYAALIDDIQALQPGAKIYVQAILPVSAKKSASSDIYNNARIAQYNQLLLQMAQQKGVTFLPVGEAVADAGGALPDDASPDGIHFTKPYYRKWLAYLASHR
nr:GDSL-type esterase/lipase family protein [Maliibacterium massiliense]